MVYNVVLLPWKDAAFWLKRTLAWQVAVNARLPCTTLADFDGRAACVECGAEAEVTQAEEPRHYPPSKHAAVQEEVAACTRRISIMRWVCMYCIGFNSSWQQPPMTVVSRYHVCNKVTLPVIEHSSFPKEDVGWTVFGRCEIDCSVASGFQEFQLARPMESAMTVLPFLVSASRSSNCTLWYFGIALALGMQSGSCCAFVQKACLVRSRAKSIGICRHTFCRI